LKKQACQNKTRVTYENMKEIMKKGDFVILGKRDIHSKGSENNSLKFFLKQCTTYFSSLDQLHKRLQSESEGKMLKNGTETEKYCYCFSAEGSHHRLATAGRRKFK